MIKKTGYNKLNALSHSCQHVLRLCVGLREAHARPTVALHVINEIADAELIAMLRTAMSELDLALAESDAEPVAWDKVRRVLEAARICFKSRDQDPVEMKVLAAIEIVLAAEPFPQPQRNDGGKPCGECHLHPGETCDVCGAKEQSDAEPTMDEDTVDAAFDKFMEGQEYKQSGTRRFFHAGVEFGLRHASRARPDTSAGLIEAAELAEEVAAEYSDAMARLIAHDIAERIRARAADRSGK